MDQEDADLLDDHFFEEESIQSNEEGSESPSENEEGSESEEEEKKEPDNDFIMINNEKVLIPKTDIYGNVLKGQEEIQQQYTQKYVPPHLRNQQTAVATPANKNNKKNALDYVDQQDKVEIKKILISGLNKLSNENFLTICQVSFSNDFLTFSPFFMIFNPMPTAPSKLFFVMLFFNIVITRSKLSLNSFVYMLVWSLLLVYVFCSFLRLYCL